MTSDGDLVADALDAILKIEQYTTSGRGAFEESELVQVWVIHHLQIIGEALGRVSAEVRGVSPGIPWSQIKAMRNIVVHDYGSVDPDVVWNAVVEGLPILKRELQSLLSELT